MKQELQDQLVGILSSISNTVGQAKDFALAQLPDIAQSYVLYGRIITTVTSGFLLLCSIVAFYFAYWAYKNPWNSSDCSWDRGKKRSESNNVVMVMGVCFGAMFLFIGFASFNWLVWFAPKVWLLKEIANLIK